MAVEQYDSYINFEKVNTFETEQQMVSSESLIDYFYEFFPFILVWTDLQQSVPF